MALEQRMVNSTRRPFYVEMRVFGVLGWLVACSSPSTSSSTHWLECSTLSDCAGVPGAVACRVGYCEDAQGNRVASSLSTEPDVSTSGTGPLAPVGPTSGGSSPVIAPPAAGGTAAASDTRSEDAGGAAQAQVGGSSASGTGPTGAGGSSSADDASVCLPPGTRGVWTPIPLEGAPTPRLYPGTVWTGSELVIFGGQDDSGGLASGGLYEPCGQRWTPMNMQGAPGIIPQGAGDTGRQIGAQVFGRTLVFFGYVGATSDTPPAEPTVAALFDAKTNAWSAMERSGMPALRTGQNQEWVGDKLIVWGGALRKDGTEYEFTNDGAVYDRKLNIWRPMNPSGAPSPRYLARAAVSGHKVVIWGGAEPNDPTQPSACARPFGKQCRALEDGAIYDMDTDTWTPVAAGNPSGVLYPALVAFGNSVAFLKVGVRRANDMGLARLDLNSNSWAPLSNPGLGDLEYAVNVDGRLVTLGTNGVGDMVGPDITGAFIVESSEQYVSLPTLEQAGSGVARQIQVHDGRIVVIERSDYSSDQAYVADFDFGSMSWSRTAIPKGAYPAFDEPGYWSTASRLFDGGLVYTGAGLFVWGGARGVPDPASSNCDSVSHLCEEGSNIIVQYSNAGAYLPL